MELQENEQLKEEKYMGNILWQVHITSTPFTSRHFAEK